MELHNLIKITKRTTKKGRGISAGQGKTSGRGTKGQKSRTGSSTKFFEGGQTPIWMRLPKAKGFNSIKDTGVISVSINSIKSSFKESESLSSEKIIEKFKLRKKSQKKNITVKIIGDKKEIKKFKFDDSVKISNQEVK